MALHAAMSAGMLACAPAFSQTVQGAVTTLETTTVTGEASVSNPTPVEYAGGQVARGGQLGVLGNIDNMDAPFVVTSYTSKLIEDQQARTLGDVVKNDASVQVGNGFGNSAETFSIRGFALNNDDLSFNGLYGILPRQVLPTQMIERVEILKGANAFLNGAAPGGSGLGGSINIQPKRAGADPLTRATIDYTSDSQVGGSVDIGRRWGDSQQFGIRVNAAHRDGDTVVDDAGQRMTVGTVGLDYLGEQLRVSLDAGYQKYHYSQPRPTIVPTDSDAPSPPSNHTNYGQPWTYSELESTFGVLRAEYDFSSNWMGYAAIGTSHDRESGDYGQPRVNADGMGTVARLTVPYTRDSVSGEIGMRGKFQTGAVGHLVNAGVSRLQTRVRQAWEMSATSPIDIYDPEYFPRPDTTFSGGDIDDPHVSSRTHLTSFALSDQLSFLDDRVFLTIGTRYQTLKDKLYTNDGVPDTTYDKSIWTPAYGLVVRPWEQVSFYVNHIEGLSKGDSAPLGASNFGETLAPYRTKQTEAGVKLDFGDIGGNIGVFQIEKPEAYTNSDNVFELAGSQRNRGLEMNIYGEPMRGVRLLGGITFMDPELRGTQGGKQDGNDAIGVPRYQAVLGAEWDVPALTGLTLQAYVQRRGSQYVNIDNTGKIPAWTRIDLGARYATKIDGRNVVWRAGVDNVTDKEYWSTVGNDFGQITQGMGRVYKLSMSVDF
ncbi:TonB-dependent receptor [Bordetella petrii]|uniref:TonB-dependent receptor n=1 Tax=Bordetella petrii TaxID=94624 RepID=UPI001A95C6FA|nr:TonB-dependent siderophore receptor [Bordetella petrii]MBO1112411.1 TonB-dependent siderophore receptor [Bordetella petrii]